MINIPLSPPFFRSDTKGIFMSAYEFVGTHDTNLSRKMTVLELDRAECEFKFCHFWTEWPFMGLTLSCLADCED